MDWIKDGPKTWICRVPPDGRFTLTATQMGDLRWAWKIIESTADNPMATGIVNSPGAAKHAMENFLKKKGFVLSPHHYPHNASLILFIQIANQAFKRPMTY